jgi:predicted nucleic acid-binding protein
LKRFLLDTNVLSETRKSRPHGAVIAWLNSLVREQVFFPSVVFWELQGGIELTRKQDPDKAQEIEAWVDDVVRTQQIVPMEAVSFRECARLMLGKPQDLLEDAMIAATARVYAMTVATRNESDFALFDVPVLNPFRLSP